MAMVEADFLKGQTNKTNTIQTVHWRHTGCVDQVQTRTRQLLENLNNFHLDLRFTHTSTESVTYLDVDIYKGRFNQTGRLDYKTHFKTTNEFQYLHYRSAHPNSMEQGLVKGELAKIAWTTNNPSIREKQSQTILKAFNRQGYPRQLTSSSMISQTSTINRSDS